eukprot:m.18168 g.18168  ORF g.18168 m.18168 type:complete len:420 (-) comp7706_c0_seq1:863-2122(-)
MLRVSRALQSAGAKGSWASVPMGPPDAILGLTQAFLKDTFPQKVNLGVGAYRNDQGKPVVLDCVRKAADQLHREDLNREYSAIDGDAKFRALTADLAFDKAGGVIQDQRVATAQTLSGTGALRLAADFLSKFYKFPTKDKQVFLPTPTWGNHGKIFEAAGLTPNGYAYYDPSNFGLNFGGMQEAIDNMPEGSVVVLHACAHNPTGVDPSPEQWRDLAKLTAERNHVVLFDMAYQGFASGDFDHDAYAVRHFVDQGINPLLCQSFAKNMGLYGERVGMCSVVTANQQEANAVSSQLKIIIRPGYSSPPINGARIATQVMGNDSLRAEWKEQVVQMATRMRAMRESLVAALAQAGSTRDWSHLTDQIGMFAFTGLTPAQVDAMVNEHHIYLTQDGRVSIAGITPTNVDYIAQSIHKVTQDS